MEAPEMEHGKHSPFSPLFIYMNYKNGLETASNMTYTINA
jgi:hypothetical protein